MKILLATAFASASLLATVVFAEDPVVEAPLTWQTPFSPVSGQDAKDQMVVLLITNDDPFAKPADDKKAEVPIWCDSIFARAYRKLIRERPELEKRLVLQKRAAGMPEQLSSDASRNNPSRAIVAVTDANYRLLELGVGVPDSDTLTTLIENAEESAMFIGMHEGESQKIVEAVAQRSGRKLTRTWKTVLDELVTILNDDDDDAGTVQTKESLLSHIGRVGESLESVYLSDVKLRFALSDSKDVVRLAILEQHLEARAPWCKSMLPFVMLNDFGQTWRPLTEVVWKQTPIIDQPTDQSLLDWWDANAKRDVVILAIEPPILAKARKWPPVGVDAVADKRGMGWHDLQKLLVEKPYRVIDAQQLASLIRQRKLPSVELNGSGRLRYLMIKPIANRVTLIRESDVPSKFIGVLKRTK